METKLYKLSSLKPNLDNPRFNLDKSDPRYKELVSSLKRFGYVSPIIVNKVTGNVISGHQRIKALKELKVTEVEVIEISVPKDKEIGLVIGLNSIKGDWEIQKLQQLISTLKEQKVDFAGSGFSKVELKVLLNQANETKQLKKLLSNGTRTNLAIKWSCNIGACSFKISDELYKGLMDLVDKQVDLNKVIELGI